MLSQFWGKIVLPVVILTAIVVLVAIVTSPAHTAITGSAIVISATALISYWAISIARWMYRKGAPAILSYLLANITVSLALFTSLVAINAVIAGFTGSYSSAGVYLILLAPIAWFLLSIVFVQADGIRSPQRLVFWRLLGQPPGNESIVPLVKPGVAPQKTPTDAPLPVVSSTVTPLKVAPEPTVAPPLPTSPNSAPAETPPSSPVPPALPAPAAAASYALFRPLWQGDEVLDTGAVSIPKRTAKSATGVQPHVNNFVQEARRYADWTGRACAFYPFMQYWPTYADMLPTQLQWYFYWRSEFRNGRPLQTDLSYIFVHTYELLNPVGVANSEQALERLESLWLAYRPAFPKLDNYLVDWIADFIVVQRLPMEPMSWYAYASAKGASPRNSSDVMLEALLHSNIELHSLRFNMLARMSNYSPQQSKFYRAHRTSLDLDAAYRAGLSAVDAHLRNDGKGGLLQAYGPKRTYVLKRQPFLSALHGYSEAEIKIANVHAWSSTPALLDAVTSIMRQSENVVRANNRYRSMLRGVVVPKEWESAIDAALTPTKSKQEIKIDLAAAAALRIESEAVRQRLIVEDAEPATDEDGVPSPAPPQRQVRIDPSAAESLRIESEAVRQRLMIEGAADRELAIEDWATAAALPQTDAVSSDPSHQQPPAAEFADAYLQRPEDAPSGLLTDLPSIFKIMGGPGEDRSQLLRVMRDMGWQALPSALAAQFAGQFINVTIDHINEISYGELGDALLFDEGDLWVVTEDYRDEIVHILDHPDYLQFETPIVTTPAVEYPSNWDPKWQQLAERLDSRQWQALAVIDAATHVQEKLDAISRSTLTTSNQLVDEINELALDTTGDNLIDAKSSIPAPYEEYAPAVHELVAWAHEHRNIEVTL